MKTPHTDTQRQSVQVGAVFLREAEKQSTQQTAEKGTRGTRAYHVHGNELVRYHVRGKWVGRSRLSLMA